MNDRRSFAVRGFSTLEMTVVMGIIFILLGIVSLNMVNLIGGAQSETALSTLNATFKAARQAALTTREERRVVIRALFASDARNRKDAYERQPRFEIWVDRVDTPGDWDIPTKIAPPLTEILPLQGGVLFTDVNGIAVMPSNPSSAPVVPNTDLRSFETYFVFDSRGRISAFYQQGQRFVDNDNLTCNLALHFIFGDTVLPVNVTGNPSVEYLSQLHEPQAGICAFASQTPPLAFNQQDEIGARTLSHTLYLIRLTGQSLNYDYGIRYPWPNSTLPEDFGGNV